MNLGPLLNLLFPPHCLACRAPLPNASQGLCALCKDAILCETNLRCGRCFARLPGDAKICHTNFPYILGAATHYHDARVRALVQGLKFRHAHAAAATLAELTERYLRSVPLSLASFAILPIPLSHKRERKRGYNQSQLIAARVGNALGIPVITDALVRTIHAQPQSELSDWRARHMNVAGAFAVPVPHQVARKDILLFDDVTTSGATFFEASVALKCAGARRIIAVAAAKA